ncbi:MAG TPA: lysylphosphatidylglycerol synthase transmembrane domain-containing protein [Planctomycetota bacterium]|nr:lysylphosphatidylglycerol synthase transmembrane domain-containing protein [Planctomycetota bacterium]
MWKKIFFGASFLLGLGLVVFVFRRFGFKDAVAVVGQIGPVGLAVYFMVAAMTLIAPAVSWLLLLRADGLPVSLATTLKANFMGFPVNFIAPTMFLGSEPLKMLYVSQRHGIAKGRVLATIIVGKVQEVGALLAVMIVSAVIAVWRIQFSVRDKILILSAMALLAAVFGLMLWAFIGNRQPSVKLINALARFKRLRRKLARLRSRAEEMEHLIHAAFTKRWRLFLASQAITLLSAVAILLRPWVFFYFAQNDYLGMEVMCGIYLVTNVINSLPHTPGGLGVFELGMAGFFVLVGLGQHNANAYSLINRASDLFLMLVGVWLIVHLGLQSVARRVAKGEETVQMEEAQVALEPPGSEGRPEGEKREQDAPAQ